MKSKTVEIEILVRDRDEAHNPVGKPGHLTMKYKVDQKMGAKARQLLAHEVLELTAAAIRVNEQGQPKVRLPVLEN